MCIKTEEITSTWSWWVLVMYIYFLVTLDYPKGNVLTASRKQQLCRGARKATMKQFPWCKVDEWREKRSIMRATSTYYIWVKCKLIPETLRKKGREGEAHAFQITPSSCLMQGNVIFYFILLFCTRVCIQSLTRLG